MSAERDTLAYRILNESGRETWRPEERSVRVHPGFTDVSRRGVPVIPHNQRDLEDAVCTIRMTAPPEGLRDRLNIWEVSVGYIDHDPDDNDPQYVRAWRVRHLRTVNHRANTVSILMETMEIEAHYGSESRLNPPNVHALDVIWMPQNYGKFREYLSKNPCCAFCPPLENETEQRAGIQSTEGYRTSQHRKRNT